MLTPENLVLDNGCSLNPSQAGTYSVRAYIIRAGSECHPFVDLTHLGCFPDQYHDVYPDDESCQHKRLARTCKKRRRRTYDSEFELVIPLLFRRSLSSKYNEYLFVCKEDSKGPVGLWGLDC